MAKKKKPIIIILIAAFIALALIFGLVLGIISIVKNARAVIAYEGVTLEREEATYLISRYKVSYLSYLLASGVKGAKDAAEFWASKDEDGVSYGERFEQSAINYLREVVVACYLFDRYSSLTSDDKETIKKACTEVLEYQADGNEERFNSLAKEYGFDYDSFCSATEILYKSSNAMAVIYGTGGAALASSSADCESYLAEYSHVKLLFIRTEEKMTVNEEGYEVFEPLSDEEKAKRASAIEEIKAAIVAFENDADGQMTPEAFEAYLAEYSDGDAAMDTLGYYFHKDAEATAEFATAFPEVVKTALTMSNGSYALADTELVEDADGTMRGMDGVCFLYKYNASAGAYANDELEAWFSDFYSDAALSLFTDAINGLKPDVKIKDKLSEINVIAIPKNTVFAPKFT